MLSPFPSVRTPGSPSPWRLRCRRLAQRGHVDFYGAIAIDKGNGVLAGGQAALVEQVSHRCGPGAVETTPGVRTAQRWVEVVQQRHVRLLLPSRLRGARPLTNATLRLASCPPSSRGW